MSASTMGRPPVYANRPAPTLRLPLRDELYLLAHNDDTGTAHIHTRSLAVGLAGATLMDLVLHHRANIDDGRIHLPRVHAGRAGPSGDLLADAAVASIRTGPILPDIAGWLRGFADAELYERARANLHTVGILSRQPRRLRADIYQSVDTAWAVRARGRVRSVLYGFEQPDTQCAALCGLIDALAIHERLFIDESAHQIRNGLRVVAARHYPTVQHVTAAVTDVVGDLATAVYR